MWISANAYIWQNNQEYKSYAQRDTLHYSQALCHLLSFKHPVSNQVTKTKNYK